MSSNEWAAVLKLSTTWGFAAVRAAAISKLSQMPLDPIEKVILAKQHNIEDWLTPALNELAQRQASLDMRDAARLEPVVGLEFILKLAQVRESIVPAQSNLASNSKARCQYCSRYNHCTYCAGSQALPAPRASHDFTSTIRTVFSLTT